MRVCILSTTFPRFKDDFYANFIYQLAIRLRQKGVKIRVIAAHHSGIPRKEQVEDLEVFRFKYLFPARFQSIAYDGGIPAKIEKSTSAKAQIPFFMIAFWWLAFWKSRDCDLIHANWTISGLIAILVNVFRRVPIILTVHGSSPKAFGNTIDRYVLGKVDHVIAVSHDVKRKICRSGIGEDKVTVIHNGVDISRFCPSRSNKCGYNILWVGRMASEKGLEYLLQALKHISGQVPECMLTLVGDGQLRQELERTVNNLGLQTHVSFEGVRPHSSVSEYFRKADIFVLPSLREGFGIVLIEAMASGVPVIASRIGGIEDIVEDGVQGFLVEPKNAEQIAEKAMFLFAHEDVRRSFGEAGRKRVEESFTWEKMAEKTLDVYLKTMQE